MCSITLVAHGSSTSTASKIRELQAIISLHERTKLLQRQHVTCNIVDYVRVCSEEALQNVIMMINEDMAAVSAFAGRVWALHIVLFILTAFPYAFSGV
jgi:hypothetical protein